MAESARAATSGVTIRELPPAASLQMDSIEAAGDVPKRHGRHQFQRKRPSSVNIRSMHGQMDGDETAKLKVYYQSDSKVSLEQLDNLRTSLKNFYDTPCEKWKSKPRKFPFKLLLQLLKVAVVTIQIITFAEERSSFERFSQRNQISFHHLFLKDWDSGREVPPYPPASGPYAVYSRSELYEHINHVLYQYYRFEKVSLTDFRRIPNDTVNMTALYYEKAELYPLDKNFYVYPEVSPKFEGLVLPESIGENCTDFEDENCYDVSKYLDEQNETIDFARLTELRLHITLNGINVKQPEHNLRRPIADVECVQFKITIVYDNSGGNGETLINLKTLLDMRTCYKGQPTEQQVLESSVRANNEAATIALAMFDGVVLLLCAVSFLLSGRSTIHRIQKCKNANNLFKSHYNYQLTIPEMSDFLSAWYIQNMISDTLVIAGTGVKIFLRFGSVATEETFDNDQFYNSAAILLGVASLAQWIGLLRYLGFFHRYYLLILTINHAVPALIRFLVCGLTIYIGFTIAGWVTLGPYNPKSGECFKKTFLQHFVDDTLVVVGKTKDKNKKVYENQTAEEVDDQYGVLSTFLCCFDRCVHHDANVTKLEDEQDFDLRTLDTELEKAM
ncbi:mucolipin-3-like isoform X2 [Watersipora subatra]|uniref:mucolipin-3-like isoform X2 n=1 Tax=Watersipora subatra TaxID=2589382 RepID=UPI00355C965D